MIFLLLALLFYLIYAIQLPILLNYKNCSRLTVNDKEKVQLTRKISFSHIVTFIFVTVLYFLLLNTFKVVVQISVHEPLTRVLSSIFLLAGVTSLFFISHRIKKMNLYQPVLGLLVVIVLFCSVRDSVLQKVSYLDSVKDYYFYSNCIIYLGFIFNIFMTTRYFYSYRVFLYLIYNYLLSSAVIVIGVQISYYSHSIFFSTLYQLSLIILFIYVPFFCQIIGASGLFNNYDISVQKEDHIENELDLSIVNHNSSGD